MKIEIKNPELKEFILYSLEAHPTYGWVPSSRSGKYHPKDEYRPGGNAKHIQRVCRLLWDLIRDDAGKDKFRKHETFTDDEKDLLYAAAILHDMNKAVQSGKVAASPNIIAQDLRAKYGRGWHKKPWTLPLVELVAVHGGAFYGSANVGRWTFTYDPNNKMHRTLHLADYVASRNYITIDTENPDRPNWVPRWKWWYMKRYLKWMERFE